MGFGGNAGGGVGSTQVQSPKQTMSFDLPMWGNMSVDRCCCCCQGGILMKNYEGRVEASWIHEELERVRNIRPGFR